MGLTAAQLNQRRYQTILAKLEDAEELINLGEWPERIATRVGYSGIETLAGALNRAGHRDLVAKLRTADRLSQTYRNSLMDDEDRKISARWNGRGRKRRSTPAQPAPT